MSYVVQIVSTGGEGQVSSFHCRGNVPDRHWSCGNVFRQWAALKCRSDDFFPPGTESEVASLVFQSPEFIAINVLNASTNENFVNRGYEASECTPLY